MIDRVAMICISRGRPDNVERAVKAWKENSECSDFIVGLDEDDEKNYPRIDGVIYSVMSPMRIVAALNARAIEYAQTHIAIGIQDDDHLIRTKGWDTRLMQKLREMGGVGYVYANDLLQKNNLGTSGIISSNIIRELGYVSSPTMKHLYGDCLRMSMASQANCISYLEDVVIEHMHWSAGKAIQDKQYDWAYQPAKTDEIAYKEWAHGDGLKGDVEKVKKVMREAGLLK